MYFFKHKGKQVADFRGDLLLTHNPNPLVSRIKSAGPGYARNLKWVKTGPGAALRDKIRASRAALAFIWAKKSQALDWQTIDREGV